MYVDHLPVGGKEATAPLGGWMGKPGIKAAHVVHECHSAHLGIGSGTEFCVEHREGGGNHTVFRSGKGIGEHVGSGSGGGVFVIQAI